MALPPNNFRGYDLEKKRDILRQTIPIYLSGVSFGLTAKLAHTSTGYLRGLFRACGMSTRHYNVTPFPLRPLMDWTGLPPTALGDSIEVNSRVVKRWVSAGLTIEEADSLACAAGVTPDQVWVDWWSELDRYLKFVDDTVERCCGNLT